MKLKLFVVAVAGVVLAAVLNSGVALAGPASDGPDKGSATSEKSLPLRSTEYGVHNSDGSVSPAAYPTGCGLTVLISRSGNFIEGDTFTGCSFVVASIEHHVTVERSRWWGWEVMRQVGPHTAFNTSSHFTSQSYNCAGTGIHDFRTVGSGQVIPYGQSPLYAQAYDRIDNQNCG